MSARRASVIVVSRHRAAALVRCLVALTQQDHPEFEVIVVADPAGIAAVQGFACKRVVFDEANISAARNAGLARAAAPVVAFIDDDACAEPTWLSQLTAPLVGGVDAATGFVIGRNGISRQWGAAWVDATGRDYPFELAEAGVYAPQNGLVIKTQGTNCAFRRDALLAVGGFDPAFRFYLDEVDVNLRMQAVTAVVPMAQVVHGFAASAQRRADRVPLSLHDIGASTVCLLRRHARAGLDEAVAAEVLSAQTARVRRLVTARRISAEAGQALLQSLRSGMDDGGIRPLLSLPPLVGADDFLPMPGTGPRSGRVIAGRVWQRARLLSQARLAAQSQIVTVVCLSPTLRPHWMTFQPEGFWLQEGGLYGRSIRSGPRFRMMRFATRLRAELARLRPVRPLD